MTTKHHGPRPIRVLLVDDSKSVRAVLRRFFARTEDVQVVGEAGDGAQAVAAAKELEPDVVPDAVRCAGALTLVQDEASSVVFGMNRAALEAGAAEVALPPRELGRTLVNAWRGATR